MSRKTRFNLPGFPQYIVQRGHNRTLCFFDHHDYCYYLDSLLEAAIQYECSVHAYVLMPDHIQLLVTPHIDQGVSLLMQSLGRRFVRYINHKHKRSGSLWEGRYKSCLVQDNSFTLACNYAIESAPVRARITRLYGDYPWSSYRYYAKNEHNRLLTPHHDFISLGNTSGIRRAVYQQLFETGYYEACLDTVLAALEHEMVFGDDQFKQKLQSLTSRPVFTGQPGRPRKLTANGKPRN